MSQSDLFKLQREVEARRRQVVILEKEAKEKDQRIAELADEVKRCQQESRQAHTTLENLDGVIAERCEKAVVYEKDKYRRLLEELTKKNEDLKTELDRAKLAQSSLGDKNAEIEFLNNKLRDISQAHGHGESLKDLRKQRDDNLTLRKELEAKAKELTLLSSQAEEIVAENRVLREMAGVPENYGFNLEEIKLVEGQKIEEYRARLRHVEGELEDREKEIAKLRYQLRNMSTLYGEKGLRFHQLSEEQMLLVDEFACNLREGKVDLPMTDRSRELLREVEKLKAQLQILESANLRGTTHEVTINDELLEQIRQENKEVKDLLLKVYASGFSPTPQEAEQVSRHVLQLPPVPVQDSTGEFTEGYSYRFGQKLPVADIYTGDAKRDLAGLQLQVVELLSLLNRRDEDEKMTGLELEEFRGKLREILTVQDALFDEYSRVKTGWENDVKNLHTQSENLLQELREARAQLAVYEDMKKAIESEHPKTFKAKLSEQASRIALLEVNALRLNRKYECLLSEERDLRQAYHAIEDEHAEKDVLVMKRIGKLKEWRVSATYQLQFLFRQLRQSVPLDQFEQVSQKLEVLRGQQANWLLREADLYKRIGTFESKERENLELNEKLRDLQELRLDLESELDVVSRRLEGFDQVFRVEQAVLRKLVHHMKTKHISPDKAFAAFDKNHDGRVSRMEFRSALENMGIRLSGTEFDSLLKTISFDGSIRYKEFVRKMQVYGVQVASEEQQILQVIYDGIQRLNYTLYEVFKIFDKDNDDYISRQDLFESLSNFNLGLTRQQMEKFAKLIDINKDGLIEFAEFTKVFERELAVNQTVARTDWKDELFARIAEAIAATGLTIEEAFSSFDKNRDGRISKSEFITAFSQMGAKLTRAQIDELWNSMNSDHDGFISYPEFISQFRRSTRERETNRIIEEAEHVSVVQDTGVRDKRQLAVMEAREQAAHNKAERYQVRMKHLEASLAETERQLAKLEQNHLDLTRNYHFLKEEDLERRSRLANTVSKTEAERLKQSNEILKKELAEARSAMSTYKSLVGVTADQARALKVTIERRRDEIHTFQAALRELQADSQEAATVGKLYHQVMVSRWAEATANRKYDNLLNEARSMRGEAFRMEGELMEREKTLYDVQQVLTEKIASYESRIRDLQSKAEHNISLDKANELVSQIRDLGDKKSELEDMNRRLSSQLLEANGHIEEARLLKQTADEIFETIKRENPDEISEKLVELSERVSQLRLSELKAKREMNLSKEKEEYLSRLHTQDLSAIKTLEEEVSRWEGVMARKEEAWRRKDDERQKMLLNPKFQFALPSKEVKGTSLEVRQKDEELLVLKEQLRVTENNLKLKQEQIEYLSKIRQENKGEMTMPKAAFSAEELMRIRSETEADALAQAANHTITTLQDMLDTKNAQLQRSEELLTQVKTDLVNTQNQAAIEIQRLVQELKDVKDSSQIHVLSAIESVSNRPRTGVHRPDLDSLLQEKDNRLAQLSTQLNAAVSAKDQIEGILSQLRQQLDQTKYELDIERSKNTGEAHRRELELARKQIQAKEQELQGLKRSLASLKEDLLNAAANNEAQTTEMRKVSLEAGDNTMATQNLAKAERRITAMNKRLKELRDENDALKNLQQQARDQEVKLREENERLHGTQVKRQEALDKTIRENRVLKEKLEESKKVKPEPAKTLPRDNAELKNLKDSISRLEAENKRLGEQLEVNRAPLSDHEDTVLRRLTSVLKTKRTTLSSLVDNKALFSAADFSRVLETKRVGLNNEEIQVLVHLANTHASLLKNGELFISIKKLDAVLRKAEFGTSDKSRPESRNRGLDESVGNQRLERRNEILSNQLVDLRRELEQKDAQLSHWEALARKQEHELHLLENRVEPLQTTSVLTKLRVPFKHEEPPQTLKFEDTKHCPHCNAYFVESCPNCTEARDDWHCPECRAPNAPTSKVCWKCRSMLSSQLAV